MTFIHTADWHLGNQMHDIDRRQEAKAFLCWLKEKIIEKNACTLVVAGDIFDTANPSVEARKAYYTFLASLVDTCCKNIIIIGGNHDSAVMLESSKELLEVLNIRVIGSIFGIEQPLEKMCFELVDSNSEVCGIAMAVPFIREIELRNYLNSEKSDTISDGELYSVALKKLYADVYEEAEKMRAGRAIPIIATGHLYAADLDGEVRKKNADDGTKIIDVRGTLGNVPSSVFPPVDYVALGHIHYSVSVAKNPSIRYSGSPFVMGFDEAERAHYVLFGEVEAKSKSSAKFYIEKIETPQTYIYKRILGSLDEIKVQLQQLQKNAKPNPTYLEIAYNRKIGVNAQEYLDETISLLPKNIHVASWKVLDAEKFFYDEAEGLEASEVQSLDEESVFKRLILTKLGLDAESEEGKDAIKKFLPLFLEIAGESV